LKSLLILCAIGLVCACATSRPDHFYILSAQPRAAPQPAAAPTTPVVLKVTLPSLVDRPEMILNTASDGVRVLEHERWGAPLGDLVAQTLGQNIERRRGDLLVAGPGGARTSSAGIKIAVDVVQMTARQGDRLSIETHWRIVDARTDTRTAKDLVGNESFSAPLEPDGYSAIAQALSNCLGQLADRLVAQIQ
jgi:uncharacterized lipoprotein YmbA